jgi:hypothetical protein
MSKHTQKKHKGPANRNMGLQPSIRTAPKAEKKIETPEPEAKKTEAPKPAAQSKPSKPGVKEVVKVKSTAKALEIEEPVEEAEVSKKAEIPKKSFFAGVIESVKKMVKSG